MSPLTTRHVTSRMTMRAYQLSCLLLPLKETIYEAHYYRYLLAHLQGQVVARVEADPPSSCLLRLHTTQKWMHRALSPG